MLAFAPDERQALYTVVLSTAQVTTMKEVVWILALIAAWFWTVSYALSGPPSYKDCMATGANRPVGCVFPSVRREEIKAQRDRERWAVVERALRAELELLSEP